MRPMFGYLGSKWMLSRHYPRPSRDLVIEPFAGSACYSLYYDCPRVDLYDTDPMVAGVWLYLLRATTAEIMALPDMPEVGGSVHHYAICQEAKWLIGLWLNHGPKAMTTHGAVILGICLQAAHRDMPENLWPQSFNTEPWNAGVKDRLEWWLVQLVCGGAVLAEQAQQEIATDWIAAYVKYCPSPADCPTYCATVAR